MLITVPHTGTFFTIELLTDMGVPFEQLHVYRFEARDHVEILDRPAIVTLRDPMMAMISTFNREEQYSVDLWEHPAEWNAKGRSNVHFFRVDCPENERDAELESLRLFVEADLVASTDWTPENTYPDVFDMKSKYSSGVTPPQLETYARELRAMPLVITMFRDHGYELPWMNVTNTPEFF